MGKPRPVLNRPPAHAWLTPSVPAHLFPPTLLPGMDGTYAWLSPDARACDGHVMCAGPALGLAAGPAQLSLSPVTVVDAAPLIGPTSGNTTITIQVPSLPGFCPFAVGSQPSEHFSAESCIDAQSRVRIKAPSVFCAQGQGFQEGMQCLFSNATAQPPGWLPVNATAASPTVAHCTTMAWPLLGAPSQHVGVQLRCAPFAAHVQKRPSAHSPAPDHAGTFRNCSERHQAAHVFGRFCNRTCQRCCSCQRCTELVWGLICCSTPYEEARGGRALWLADGLTGRNCLPGTSCMCLTPSSRPSSRRACRATVARQ